MPLCRYVLTPLSPFSTPLRSDTLNGMVLYRMAEDEGEQAVARAIDAFKAGRPPFALSSAFPRGFLPMPKMPSPRKEAFSAMHRSGAFGKLSLFEALQAFKTFRKLAWIPAVMWRKHSSRLSLAGLFMEWLSTPDAFSAPRSTVSREPHVSTDRTTGTVGEGGLFFREATFTAPGTGFHVWAEADDPAWLLARLERIGMLGYGKDASSGRGRFRVELEEGDIPCPEGATHRLLLSRWAAPSLEGLEGWYALEVKRGFSGPGASSPYKAPFLSVAEGSVLSAMPGTPAVLEGLHPDGRITQVLAPVTLPCTPEEAR